MPARRVIALLLGILMLHLAVVGADLQCARHGNGERSTAMAASHRMIAVSDVPAAAKHTSSEQPCETPAPPECCRAMTSCAITLALGERENVGGLPLAREAVQTSGITT